MAGTAKSTTLAKCILCICVWWSCAVAVTLGIKHVLGKASIAGHKNAEFPFPFALTAICNAFTACVAGAFEVIRFIVSRTCSRGILGQVKAYAPAKCSDVLHLVLIGFVQGVEIGCTNKALEFLSVAKRTMVMSTSLLFMMGVAVPSGLEILTCGKVVAALMLTMGGCLQGLSSWRHRVDAAADARSLQGYAIVCVSLMLSAGRWSLLQHIMQRAKPNSFFKRLTKMQMVACIMPVTSAVCFILAATFEIGAFDRIDSQVMQDCSILSLLLVVMVSSELMFVQLTSAVAMGVASQLHNIPIVLGGVVLFREKVHPFAVIGFVVCISGALLYTAERRKTSKEQVSQKEDNEMDDFVSNRSGCNDRASNGSVELGALQSNGVFGDDFESGIRAVAAASDRHNCVHEPKPVIIGAASAFE